MYMSSYYFSEQQRKTPFTLTGFETFFKARSTTGGTRSTTLPPYLATSFTMLELKMNIDCLS